MLSGRGGADLIYGNGGDDILIGGAGVDELWGGVGADTFVFRFADATSSDKVKDFSAGDHIGIYASDYGLSLGNGLVDDGTGKLVLDPAYFVAVAGSASYRAGHVVRSWAVCVFVHLLDPDADVGCGRRRPLTRRRARYLQLGRHLERRRLHRHHSPSDCNRERLAGAGARACGR